jgi:uncharacterized membrane protein YdbT with pleckstrin-like domain
MRLVTPGDTAPASVSRYLLPNEKQVITVRMHPAILLGPVSLVLLGLVIAGLLSGVVGGSSTLLDIIWLAWSLLLLRLIWKVANWSVDYYVVTSHRMLLITGLLTRNVAFMPLEKVTDMSFQRSAKGRVLHYGKFVVESAGQQQALREVDFVPYPEQLYLEVTGVLPSLRQRSKEVEGDD